MRNLITGIFTLLAGTFFVGGRQMLNDKDGVKSKDQMKTSTSIDSLMIHPKTKTPEPPVN